MDAVRFGRALGFGARQAVKTVASAVDAATARSPSDKSVKPAAAPGANASAAPSEGAGLSASASPGANRVAASANPAGSSARAAAETAATPTQTPKSAAGAGTPAVRPAVNKAARAAAQGEAKGAPQARGLRRGLSRFREAAWEPFARLSGVLWLEVTGVFFAIFALFAAASAWRLHREWRAGVAHPGAHRDLAGAVAMFALFGYFCVSSFVRARRRERRKG